MRANYFHFQRILVFPEVGINYEGTIKDSKRRFGCLKNADENACIIKDLSNIQVEQVLLSNFFHILNKKALTFKNCYHHLASCKRHIK